MKLKTPQMRCWTRNNEITMKRQFILAFAVQLIIAVALLTGCGGTGSTDADAPEQTTQAQEQTTEAQTTQAQEENSQAAQEESDQAAQEETRTGEVDPADSSGFVLISEAVPDAILEIRYYSTYNFVGDRINGYEEPLAFITKEAAAALKEVSDDVGSQGYRLKIYDAYRPQMAVTHFMEWAKDFDDTRMKEYFYPDLDKSDIFNQGYVAEKSGHSRGSAVDLTLFDMETEKEADMGGTFDFFGVSSHSDYKGITDEQYENRMILREAMLKHGFKPTPLEWWHFTLENEPFPDTYFTFPVNSDQLTDQQDGEN